MTQAAILAASGSPGTTTGFKNRIINGAMAIDQRNNGSSVSATNGGFFVDRWFGNSFTGSSTTGKYTAQQNSGAAPATQGFSQCLKITSSAATSSSSNDIYAIAQFIEGNNIADLAWGTASAKSVTISFWVRSSATGTFGLYIRNNDNLYNYPTTYTISVADTWEYKTVTIPGPTAGTWLTNNNAGIGVYFQLQVGSSFTAPAGAWTTSQKYGTDGCVSLLTSSGATWYITGVQLEAGTTATNFDFRSYGTEFALCQRYFQKTGFNLSGRAESGTLATCVGKYIVEMRTAPSATISTGTSALVTYGVSGYDVSSLATLSNSANDFRQAFTTTGSPAMSAGNIINGYNSNWLWWSAEL